MALELIFKWKFTQVVQIIKILKPNSHAIIHFHLPKTKTKIPS